MKNTVLYTVGLLLAFLLLSSCSAPQHTLTPLPKPQGEEAKIGVPAPDFTMSDLKGESVSLSSFKGKPVIVAFWGMGCPACIEEMSVFQDVYSNYAGRVVILAVNVGQPLSVVQNFAKEKGLTFPILFDWTGQWASNYGRGFPTTYFVDDKGVVFEIVDPTFESVDEVVEILDAMGVK